jgi:hypothetical protein
MSSPAHLDYAPPPTLIRRRSVRLLIALAVVLGLAIYIRQNATAAIHRACIMYWQHECMIAQDPPGHVAAHANSAGMRRCPSESSRCFDALLTAAFGKANRSDQFSVFTHELCRPDGKRRLVNVNASNQPVSGLVAGYQLIYEVFDPVYEVIDHGPGVCGPQYLSAGITTLPCKPNSQIVDIYAGQPDPLNASHFTIVYTIGNGLHTIDGFLDSTDTLTLSERQARKNEPHAPYRND